MQMELGRNYVWLGVYTMHSILHRFILQSQMLLESEDKDIVS